MREEVRSGHRVKLYRAAQQTYTVPLEATSHTDLASYLQGVFAGSASILSQGVAKTMEQAAPRWSFEIRWIQEGLVQTTIPLDEIEPERPSRVCWYSDSGLQLEREVAAAFKEELSELYEKYRQQADEEGEWHFFFAGLTAT